jgi:hypothetical protein
LENNMKTLRDYIDLVNERFNQALSEKVTLPADGSTPQTQTVNGVTMNAPANAVQTGSGGVLKTGSGAAVTSGTPAPAPDAAAAAKAKLTPSQLKWLGGADATDQYIMARMPKPLPGETVPGAAPAAAAPAAAAAPDTAGAYDDEGNMMPGWSKDENGNPVKVADQDGKTFVEPATQASADKSRADAQAATQAANGVNAQGQNVTMPNGINPETGEPTTVTAAAPAPVAQAGQAKPAAGGKVPPQPTLSGKPSTGPKGQAWLQKYGATHNPDGTPKTAGAPAAPAPAAPANPNGAGRDPTGAYRGDRTNPAPAARDPNGAYRGDRTNPAPTPIAPGQNARDDLLARKPAAPAPVAKEGRTDRNDHAFIDELNAMRSIAGLPTKNKW